jgi:uncharacterized protein YndB with AHSA1/START domain
MAVNVCPADTVHAPVERVWALLMQPAGYGRFWDMTVERLEPEGPAVVGQKLFASTRALGRRWVVEGEIREVDTERHQILFHMSLPLGLVSSNRIMCSAVDEQSCVVRFG